MFNKYLMQSLPKDPEFIQTLLLNDKEIMKLYGLSAYAIKTGKYRDNKQKQKLKLLAIKNEFSENFLIKFLKRKEIIIKILNKSILDYFKSSTYSDISYKKIMMDLDNLLNIDIKKIDERLTKLNYQPKVNEVPKEYEVPNKKPLTIIPNIKPNQKKCNCKNEGFGFCFHN